MEIQSSYLPDLDSQISPVATIASFLTSSTSSGVISGSGLAQAKIIGFSTYFLPFFDKILLDDKPKKTSAPTITSSNLLFVIIACSDFHLFQIISAFI